MKRIDLTNEEHLELISLLEHNIEEKLKIIITYENHNLDNLKKEKKMLIDILIKLSNAKSI